MKNMRNANFCCDPVVLKKIWLKPLKIELPFWCPYKVHTKHAWGSAWATPKMKNKFFFAEITKA